MVGKIISVSLAVYVLISCILITANAEPLIEVNFAQTGIDKSVRRKGIFQGELPKGMSVDFPQWNTSVATAEKKSENGLDFVRFNVKQFDYGVFFRIADKKINVPDYYELEIVSRCHDLPLNLHIRQGKKPYKMIWEADSEEKSGWDVQRFVFHLKESKTSAFANSKLDTSNMVLYLSLKPGITDIASIKLTKIGNAKFLSAKSAEIKRPQKGIVNFFRNSRFPLGLQSGWNVNRDNVGGETAADPDTIGPSGFAALKITSQSPIKIYSEPFQTDDPEKKVRIAFYCKGSGSWSAESGGITKAIPLADRWGKIEFDFQPDPLTRGYHLVFAGKGTLYIDSLMAYSGETLKEYSSAGECEVALAPANSNIAETRISFSDEIAKVKYCVTGKLAEAVLKSKVVNINGMERELPEIKLDGKAQGVLGFDVFPEAPLGQFRIEAWVERDGKRISPYNEIIMTRIRRPLYWGRDAPDSPFGGHFFSNERIVSTMKAAGMNWERLNDSCMEGTCWGWLEPERGKWVFADDKIAAYRNGNIKILGYLGSAPEWASYFHGEKHSFSYFNKMYQPRDIEAFKNYLKVVVTRYKGVIDEYQFQNEPWGKIFWHMNYNPKTGEFGQGQNPAIAYAQLSKIAYLELKKLYPEAVMYGFNTGGSKGKEWTQEVFDQGGYDYCDVIDYHCYNSPGTPMCTPGDFVDMNYQKNLGYIQAKVKPPMKPVVMSEGNPTRGGTVPADMVGSEGFSGMMKHSVPWGQDKKAAMMADLTCRFVINYLALKVKRVFLYSDHCYHHMLRPPTFPVLLGADGYPYPTLAAFSNMAWLLEDRSFIKHVPVGKNTWAYIFYGRSKSVAVISGKQGGTYAIPDNPRLETLDLFGNVIKNPAESKRQLVYVVSDLSADNLGAVLAHKK